VFTPSSALSTQALSRTQAQLRGQALLPILTSEEAAARDRAAIDAGVPSRALMQRAGAATAAEIALRFGERLHAGALILAGPGNNGGDGWVIARALAAAGVRVRVCEPVPARTDDARAERALALPSVEMVEVTVASLASDDIYRGEGVVVDALLGTGASGPPRAPIVSAMAGIRAMRRRNATIVAVDIPTGVDATTGQTHQPPRADVTFTYGTLKRGHVLARAACGRVIVLDIGLPVSDPPDDDSVLAVTGRFVAAHVPRIAPDAHKGTRKKIAIVGGGAGMSGAAILAARSAWRSGVGMVKLVVASDALDSIRSAEPQSLTAPWPASAADVKRDITGWADAVVIGPGLGPGRQAREIVERVCADFPGPLVLDADALNAFSGDVQGLARAIGSRPAVLTPHPMEFARLTGRPVDEVLAQRFDIARALARNTAAVVLLKGQPTIVTTPGGQRLVSATGTPLLAAAGSGDVLSGMIATLLAQTGDPATAAACSAWVHGRAAWLAQRGGADARGFTLDDVLAHLARAWSVHPRPARYPVLLELPDLARR